MVAGNLLAETDANGEKWFTRSHLRIRRTANDDDDDGVDDDDDDDDDGDEDDEVKDTTLTN